jgi:speckle-type POZ protein
VKAQAKFSLLDQASRPLPPHTQVTSLREYSGRNIGHVFAKFIKREFLEKSEYLKDDCIKIRCDVIVSKAIQTEDRAAAPPFVVVPPSDMHSHLPISMIFSRPKLVLVR